jgi:hypothetical protein
MKFTHTHTHTHPHARARARAHSRSQITVDTAVPTGLKGNIKYREHRSTKYPLQYMSV